jgi:CubicO group peptidase (beta-lactamase class C family)/outer membrane lipoprotein-sorting protein
MNYKIFLLILVVCGFISSCSGESTPDVDELIAKNITARGGYEKLKAVQSLKISATYVQRGKKTPITFKIKRPNLIRADVYFPGQHSSATYDGKTAMWLKRSSPRAEPQVVSEEMALIFTRYKDFGNVFVDYKKKGQTFELTGTEETTGKKYYKLKTSFSKDIIRFLYLDADSFLITKESFKSNSKPGPGMTIHYKDFKEADGVLYPFYHDAQMGNMPAEQTIIDKIETGVDLDDSVFTMSKTGKKEKLDAAGFAKELDAYLTSLTEKDLFSGVVLVAKEGKSIFKKAYGMADRERSIPNRIDTRFCLASMNKMFTSVAIAQLVEQGKLSYDDLAGKYLGTDWMLPEVAEKVKISHLLTHTSGIEEYLTDELLNASANIYRTLKDHKPLVNKKSLMIQPGTKWEYCNTGFIFLGAIIEQVSGMTYKDYIKKYIYQPLGMNDTIHFNKDKTLADVAMAYEKVDRGGKSSWGKTAFAGKINGSSAGGAFSTVEDLLKFENALRMNTLMSKTSRELHMTVKASSGSLKYGYGFLIYKIEQLGWGVGHGGSAPGVSANFRMYVDKGYTLIVLSNLTRASLPVNSMVNHLLPGMLPDPK